MQHSAKEHGITVLCSLHQVDLAVRYADRIVALKAGRVFFNGRPSEFSRDVRDRLYVS